MTCLQGLADLERLEGPWVERIAGGDPDGSGGDSAFAAGPYGLDEQAAAGSDGARSAGC